MNRWADDKELYSEIAGYAGDSADALVILLHKWQSSLPLLRDPYSYNDIIKQSKQESNIIPRWMSIAAASIAAIIVCGVVIFNRISEQSHAHTALCKAAIGNVLVQRGEKYINLANGMEIFQSDTIICDKGSMAVIQIGSATLRIDQNSQVTIDALQHTQVLSLSASMIKGMLYITAQKLHKGDSIVVKTTTAVAGVRGTTFLVKSDHTATQLIVIEGKVLLAPRLSDVPADAVSGVPVEEGKSCVIDTGDLSAIQHAIQESNVSLDDAIRQTISLSAVDKKTMQVLSTIAQDVNKAVVIDDNTHVSVNNIYPVASVTPYNKDFVITTHDGLYYCKGNVVQWMQHYPNISKPYIWNNNIIFQSKKIYALDIQGNIQWQAEIEGTVVDGGIVPVRDVIAISTSKGLLYFIDTNGRIIHKVNCNAPIISRPVLFGQMVCVATDDGYLYGIDVVLGVSIYRKHIGKIVPNGIVVRYPEMYVATTASIQKIHLLQDEVLWIYNTSEIVTAIEHPKGILFATNKGSLGILTTDGSLQWQISPGVDIHSLRYTSKGIVCIAGNVFYQFSDNGEILWSYTLPAKQTEILSSTPKYVFIRVGNSLQILRL